MISYFKNGITDLLPTKQITFNELTELIRSNPEKDKIEHIRRLDRSHPDYSKLKEELPYITPNCWVKYRNLEAGKFNTNFIESSQFIYFDIDSVDGNIREYKSNFLKKYSHLVSLVCISTGGKGLSILIKVSVPIHSKEDFKSVWSWIEMNMFGEEKLDKSVKHLGSAAYISWDPDLFVNFENELEIEGLDDYNIEIGLNQGITTQDIFNETTFNPIPLPEVLRILLMETPVDIVNPILDIKPVDYIRIKYSGKIRDGFKHKTYTRLIHELAYLNPSVNPVYIASFIYHLNERAKPPMQQRELFRLFNNVYSSIVLDDEYLYTGLKVKKVHINKSLNKKEKTSLACKVNGKLRRNKSIEKINKAKDELAREGQKISCKNISVRSGLALSTVKRNHKRSIMSDEDIERLYNQ